MLIARFSLTQPVYSMVRNFFEMFLRARRALEFSHSQDPSLPFDDQLCCDAQQRFHVASVVMCGLQSEEGSPMKRREFITLIGGAGGAGRVGGRRQPPRKA